MNRKGQSAWIWIAIAAVVLLVIYFGYREAVKPLSEHYEPADLSKEEEGTGMGMKFYEKLEDYSQSECEDAGYIWEDGGGGPACWKEKSTPDWFKVTGIITGVVGAIVKHPPAPSCSVDSDCPAGSDVRCWEGECVLANRDGISTIIQVGNSESFDFNNVYLYDATPTGYYNSLPIGTSHSKTLPSESTIDWSSGVMDIEGLEWNGTQQTFSVTVTGKHPLTAETVTASDSVTLEFIEDPTGSFSVGIQTGVPGA